MESVVLKTFFCFLVGGIAFAADDARVEPSSSGCPVPVYNPVNSITVNACCNKSEEADNLQEQLDEIKQAITHLVYELKTGEFCNSEEPSPSTPVTPIVGKDCSEIQENGGTTSGVYTITPENSPSFEVYCDMDTDGGGWTVFQRRVDDTVDFFLYWDDYKNGFGDLEGNHWLGNENLYYLTNQKTYKLRVDLEDFDDATRYAEYDNFRITDESAKYTLTLGTYSGDAGDAMAVCNGQRFSARGDENGNNCPNLFKGGWWYDSCHEANPNGLYLAGSHSSYADGMEWYQWKGYYYSLKFTELKLRPV